MGGSTSKFDSTDWDKADGSLKSGADTLDGALPTTKHTILTVTPRVMNDDREFDIQNEEKRVLYYTSGVKDTINWFDVSSSESGEALLRVEPEPRRLEWDIYSINRPAYPGQKPEADSSQRAGKDLYRKAKIVITLDKFHAKVYRFGPPENENQSPSGFCDLEAPAILCVSKIKGISSQFQSSFPRTETLLDPPLIGFWEWKGTHMKMHLGKGTDIALQLISAIVTNMMRLERDGQRHI